MELKCKEKYGWEHHGYIEVLAILEGHEIKVYECWEKDYKKLCEKYKYEWEKDAICQLEKIKYENELTERVEHMNKVEDLLNAKYPKKIISAYLDKIYIYHKNGKLFKEFNTSEIQC